MSSDEARAKIDAIIYRDKRMTAADHAEVRRLQLIIARNTLAGK